MYTGDVGNLDNAPVLLYYIHNAMRYVRRAIRIRQQKSKNYVSRWARTAKNSATTLISHTEPFRTGRLASEECRTMCCGCCGIRQKWKS